MIEIPSDYAKWNNVHLELQKALSRVQFEQIIKYGHPDYAVALDLVVGAWILRTNPELYVEMMRQFSLAKAAAKGQRMGSNQNSPERLVA